MEHWGFVQKQEAGMEKILLDFGVTKTQGQVQEYLALMLDFPDYYGKNLDALYDMLTEIGEDKCIGVFGMGEMPGRDGKLAKYLERVRRVMQDAEEENPHLCVIFQEYEKNFEGSEGELV